MQTHIAFGSTPSATITILVDNRADLIVESNETVKYFTKLPLLAEHGFSALVELPAADLRILWDAGISTEALPENMRRMEIDPAGINKVAISHGHGDHTAALAALLREMELLPAGKEWPPETSTSELVRHADKGGLPLVAHPAAFRERWARKKDGGMVGPIQPPPRLEWEAAGARVILSEEPYMLAPGCWTTGHVPRLSFERSGIPTTLLYRQGEAFMRDEIEEDQAIVINVAGKGLVVLSGCAHSGIVNTVEHARRISGVERVWAVLGGFHLARAKEDEIEQTVAAIKAWEPVLIAPSHCTGPKAIQRFADEMPEAFAYGVVGTKYLF